MRDSWISILVLANCQSKMRTLSYQSASTRSWRELSKTPRPPPPPPLSPPLSLPLHVNPLALYVRDDSGDVYRRISHLVDLVKPSPLGIVWKPPPSVATQAPPTSDVTRSVVQALLTLVYSISNDVDATKTRVIIHSPESHRTNPAFREVPNECPPRVHGNTRSHLRVHGKARRVVI